MNTKILVSLLVIGLTAVAIGGGMTGAFFSDTETSEGNTFTAGAIDLKVDSECSYLGSTATDEFCDWTATDLGAAHKFFNYADLKPGDYGENTISLHVDNNDAWACVTLNVKRDSDVDCTEPETESTDPECSSSNVGDGELDENLNWFIWADVCNDTSYDPDAVPGDNVYQDGCDVLLTSGPASAIGDGITWALADKDHNNVGGTNGDPLTGGKTYYLGAAWCLGTLDPATLACDGQLVGNDVQSDSYEVDISFNVVQKRNNPNFVCPTTPPP
mgnify:CR=1 FL=1